MSRRNSREFLRQFSTGNVQVGAADPAGTHGDADFAVAGLRIGPLLEQKRRSRRW
jgi:hypothetical protein